MPARRSLTHRLRLVTSTGQGRALRQYRAAPALRGKTFISRTTSAVEGGVFGLATDAALAESAVKVLNRLDPGQIAPPLRIRITGSDARSHCFIPAPIWSEWSPSPR